MTNGDHKSGKPCRYCNKIHKWGSRYCPAYGKTCRKCGKENHFARVCRNKPCDGKVLNENGPVNENSSAIQDAPNEVSFIQQRKCMKQSKSCRYCSAYSKVCESCIKLNHIAKVCQSSSRESNKPTEQDANHTNNGVYTDDESEAEEAFRNCIETGDINGNAENIDLIKEVFIETFKETLQQKRKDGRLPKKTKKM